MINFFEYSRTYESLKKEICEDILQIINTGVFINGDSVKKFEKEMRDYLVANSFVGLSSGTDALIVAIMAAVNKKKGNFIVPSFTFTATAMSPARLGYDIKFVDVDENSFTPSVKNVVQACDSETVGIIWPYLFGEPSDLEELYDYCKESGIVLIEDCAQSLGTKNKGVFAGNVSDVGCYSFFPTKNLGCFGDGGGVSTNSEKIYEKIKRIKSHGYYDQKYNSTIIGGNFRLDTIQATILLRIFSKFENLIAQRKKNALFYDRNITNERIIKPEFTEGHTWNQYCLVVDDNIKFKKYLAKNNIQSNVYYPVPLHKNPVFDTGESLVNTEKLCSKIISIPIYPGLPKKSLVRITEAVNRYE